MLDCQLARVGDRVDTDDVARQRIARVRTLDQRIVRRNDASAKLVVRQLVQGLHAPTVAMTGQFRHNNRQERCVHEH